MVVVAFDVRVFEVEAWWGSWLGGVRSVSHIVGRCQRMSRQQQQQLDQGTAS